MKPHMNGAPAAMNGAQLSAEGLVAKGAQDKVAGDKKQLVSRATRDGELASQREKQSQILRSAYPHEHKCSQGPKRALIRMTRLWWVEGSAIPGLQNRETWGTQLQG